jgi:hypothetical protein
VPDWKRRPGDELGGGINLGNAPEAPKEGVRGVLELQKALPKYKIMP